MAEPQQNRQAATTVQEPKLAPTGNMTPANNSVVVVEISDDNTTKSTGDTSPASSSVVEIVNDNSNKAISSNSQITSSPVELAKDDSRKRKATDDDQNTPAKKQKQSPPEGLEIKRADDGHKDSDDGFEDTARPNESSQESRQQSAATSQAGGQKQKPQYSSIEELREIANDKLKKQTADTNDLKASLTEMEEEKDQWQRRAGRSEVRLQQYRDGEEARENAQWKKAKDWKKKELDKQVEEAKQKFLKDLEKAKVPWQKKSDTQQTRLEKEQDKVEDLKCTLSGIREELKELKAAHKEELSDLKKQLRNCKPGDSKELKEKSKELETSQNLLEAQKTTNDVLAQRLSNREDDLRRIRAERADVCRKAKNFHAEWTRQTKLNDEMKADHAEDLRKQYELWQVQANNSRESQLRAVARQRGIFDLNNALDRNIEEEERYRQQSKALAKQLEQAKAEIVRLKTSATPQLRRPASTPSAAPIPADTIRA